MAGPARDGKDALIYISTPKQPYSANNLARYAAVGNSKNPYAKTNQAFGWSSKLRSNDLMFVLDRAAPTDYFFQLQNFNVGAYTTPDYYPSVAEQGLKSGLQGGTPLIVLASASERNSIILPSRQAEAKWVGTTKSGAKFTDSTLITRDIDKARKLTISGNGNDIVISGHGNDYIGPGLPIETWKAISKAAQTGVDWSNSLAKVDLGASQLELPVKANAAGSNKVHPNLWVGKNAINTGKKAYIGGSGNDLIWGGNQNDLLIGDRYNSYETYFPSDTASRQALFDAVDYTTNPVLTGLQDRLTPKDYNGSSQQAPGYNFWYSKEFGEYGSYWNNYSYMNGPIDHKYFWTRPGSIEAEWFNNNTWGRSPQYDGSHTANEPVWEPGADTLYGGEGDDTIFGDNNLPAIWRLQEAKELYNKPNSDFYYKGERGTFENWRQLGNDFLDGGPGNDVIQGGFGADHIIGGKGNDIIFIPDDITAPGFKNLIGAAGDVSWIAGGELKDRAKLIDDKSGVNSSVASKDDADVFVLGLNYTSEAAMKATKFDDGGGSSYADEMQRLENLASTRWRKFANTILWPAGQSLAEAIPFVGDIISPFFGIIDALLEKENDPANQGAKYAQPASATDATSVITDFSPTDILLIPVPKGGKCETRRLMDGSGLNMNNTDKGFYFNKQGIMISVGAGPLTYDRVWLPGLTYDNGATDPLYQLYKLNAKTDLKDYGIADVNVSQFGDQVDMWIYASRFFANAFSKDPGLF